MYTHTTQVRVRYAETDQMGYVYYGHYATYYEVGRVEALRQLGIRYKDLEAAGIMMPVLENRSKYIRPALYDDLLTIKVMVRDLPTLRIKFDIEIYNEAGTLINVGETTLVYIDATTQKVMPCPPVVVEALKAYF